MGRPDRKRTRELAARTARRRDAPVAICVAAILFALFGQATQTRAGPEPEAKAKVIVSSQVAVDRLTPKALREVFLGKKRVWPDGKRIVLATLIRGEVHKRFLRDRIRKSPSQFRVYWRRRVFSGKARQPARFETEQDLVEYVEKTPGAIGYIGARTDPAGAVVISIE